MKQRLYILAAVAAGALGFAAVDAAQAGGGQTQNVVRAQRIELVDARGQERARLNIEPGGEVVLRLFGQNGEIRLKLGASADGSGVTLLNGAAEPGVQILANESGSSVSLKQGAREATLRP